MSQRATLLIIAAVGLTAGCNRYLPAVRAVADLQLRETEAGAPAVVLAVSDRAAVAGTATTHSDSTTGLVAEIVLSTIFILVILAATKKAAGMAGLVISLTLVAVHLAGIPFSGASVNPARSFGPALFSGTDALANLPVFLIVPALGGGLSGLVATHPPLQQRLEQLARIQAELSRPTG